MISCSNNRSGYPHSSQWTHNWYCS